MNTTTSRMSLLLHSPLLLSTKLKTKSHSADSTRFLSSSSSSYISWIILPPIETNDTVTSLSVLAIIIQQIAFSNSSINSLSIVRSLQLDINYIPKSRIIDNIKSNDNKTSSSSEPIFGNLVLLCLIIASGIFVLLLIIITFYCRRRRRLHHLSRIAPEQHLSSIRNRDFVIRSKSNIGFVEFDKNHGEFDAKFDELQNQNYYLSLLLSK